MLVTLIYDIQLSYRTTWIILNRYKYPAHVETFHTIDASVPLNVWVVLSHLFSQYPKGRRGSSWTSRRWYLLILSAWVVEPAWRRGQTKVVEGIQSYATYSKVMWHDIWHESVVDQSTFFLIVQVPVRTFNMFKTNTLCRLTGLVNKPGFLGAKQLVNFCLADHFLNEKRPLWQVSHQSSTTPGKTHTHTHHTMEQPAPVMPGVQRDKSDSSLEVVEALFFKMGKWCKMRVSCDRIGTQKISKRNITWLGDACGVLMLADASQIYIDC